ncbi:MAG: hypothetical protein GWN17_14045 [Candidatus Korarchaeota archaeon]|nr:hypothetical protein [Candidatus Korarchaeota archaeon]
MKLSEYEELIGLDVLRKEMDEAWARAQGRKQREREEEEFIGNYCQQRGITKEQYWREV